MVGGDARKRQAVGLSTFASGFLVSSLSDQTESSYISDQPQSSYIHAWCVHMYMHSYVHTYIRTCILVCSGL